MDKKSYPCPKCGAELEWRTIKRQPPEPSPIVASKPKEQRRVFPVCPNGCWLYRQNH